MCGSISFSKRNIKPGSALPVMSSVGVYHDSIFGHNVGDMILYNRRLDTLIRRQEEDKFSRVLVPFDSFEERGRIVYRARRDIFLAGLENEAGETSIITVNPSKDFKRIVRHHRRPAIVDDTWPEQGPLKDLTESLRGALTVSSNSSTPYPDKVQQGLSVEEV